MSANTAFIQAYCSNEVIDIIELESIHLQFLADGIDHSHISVASIHRVFLQILVVAAFQFLDNPAGNELKRRL